MHRFFVSENQVTDAIIEITNKEDVKHIAKVLRLNIDDEIEVCDSNKEYLVSIVSFESDKVVTEVLDQRPVTTEAALDIVLLQGLPKGEKLELIIQKTTELGIKQIIPIKANRSVVKLEAKKIDQRLARWQRIAYEAAKQSKRGTVPTIQEPKTFKQVAALIEPDDCIIVLWEDETTVGLKELLAKEKPKGKVYLVIGPEGGLEVEEVELLKQIGGQPVSLGKRILRTETAGMAAAAVVMYAWGDMGGV